MGYNTVLVGLPLLLLLIPTENKKGAERKQRDKRAKEKHAGACYSSIPSASTGAGSSSAPTSVSPLSEAGAFGGVSSGGGGGRYLRGGGGDLRPLVTCWVSFFAKDTFPGRYGVNPDSSCTQPPRAGTGDLFSQNPSTGHPWSAAVCPSSQRGHLRAVPGSDVAPRAAPTAERIRSTPSKTSASYRRLKGRTPFLQRRMNAASLRAASTRSDEAVILHSFQRASARTSSAPARPPNLRGDLNPLVRRIWLLLAPPEDPVPLPMYRGRFML